MNQSVSKPFFSIVTACKDGLDLLKETATSVLSQTDSDWEWILVDDASSEPVTEWMKSLGDPRIQVIRANSPQGQTVSLNQGIRAARADWIVRMDSDDIMSTNRLTLTRQAIAACEKKSGKLPSLLFSDYEVVDQSGTWISTIRYQTDLTPEFFHYMNTKNNPICHPTVTFAREVSPGKVFEYPERLKNAQDYWLWKDIFKRLPDRPFIHIPTPLVKYRLVESSLSGARNPEQSQELAAIRESSGSLIRDFKKVGPNTPIRELGSIQRQGMHAYRILYYRFIGQKASAPSCDNFKQLRKALSYRSIALKACLLYLSRPVRGWVKQTYFRGIYL